MIESLITSKTRIKLLLKFFLNQQTKSYLRSLATEFGDSTNAIRLELNHLEKAGLLLTSNEGNRKVFFANVNHPLTADITNMLMKYIGVNQIIDQITTNVETLEAAYLTGDFALGSDSGTIELLLIGSIPDKYLFQELVLTTENLIHRRINWICMTNHEMMQSFGQQPAIIIWKSEIRKKTSYKY